MPSDAVVHSASKDAIHIGDNRGNMDDIKHIAKVFYGDKYRAQFLLKQIPGSLEIAVSAGSVSSTGGEFICVSKIYVNDREIGELANGATSYDVDRAILKVGSNAMTLVSESCRRGSGGYASGLDDIVIKAIKITAK